MTETLSRSGRRAEQRRRRRQQQVRRIGAALGVLVLLAAAFAVYLARDAPEPPSSRATAEPRTQQTLLLQVRGAGGAGVANVLLAHDRPKRTGAAVLLPPQVLVTVAGTGSLPLGRATATVPAEGTRGALSDLMGVTVDGSWLLDQPVLAKLVDAVGGVPVDVDVQVVQGTSAVLSPGPQDLTGAQAVTFLTYLAPGEQEQARLARLQEVLDGLVSRLPAESELVAVLRGLGQGSSPTPEVPQLAAFLAGLADADEAGQLQYDVLPVVDLDPGGEVTAFRADTAATRALVDRLLASSVPPGVREGGNRVLVLNGVGTPGLGDAVRAKLVPAGFVFVGSRNAPDFGYATTQVLVPAATAEGQALGERVAKALGLPSAPVGTQEFGTVADVVVVVGADFRP